MGIITEKYVRKPLYVKAVRVTEENFDECVVWCLGEVETEGTKRFIRVRVHNPNGPRQTKAFVGDWILWHEKGYKIYTHKAFVAVFDKVVTEEEKVTTPVPATDHAGDEVARLEQEEYKPATEELEVVPVDPVEHSATHEPQVRDTASAPPRRIDGKLVITEEEARAMTTEEVRELLRSGTHVLEEDLAA